MNGINETKEINENFDIKTLKTVESTSYSSEKPHHFKQLKKIMMFYLKPGKKTIVDMNGHVGGFSLRWALAFLKDKIFTIEYDTEIFNLLEKNIETLEIKNIEAIRGDSAEEILKLKNIDAIFSDPPWGGPSYKTLGKKDLFYGKINAVDVFKKIFSRKISKYIFFKVPRNYNFKSLEALPGTYKTYNIISNNPNKPVADYLLLVLTSCS